MSRSRMGSMIQAGQNLWRQHRLATTAGIVVLLAILGVVGYLVLKRPGDVLNPEAAFESEEKAEVRGVIDWPLYGLDKQRTRYLPAKKVRPPFRRIWRFASGQLLEFSPIVVDRVVYGLGNDGLAFALEATTGEVIWKRTVARLNASAPAFHDGRLYGVSLEPGQAFALDVKTGKTLWRKPLPGRSESSPMVDHGRVYFGSEVGTLYAVDARTGKSIWETSLGGEIKGAPALDRGILYIGTYAGDMHAVRAKDGSVKWSSSDQGTGFGRSGSFYGSPAVAFGRVYAGNLDGRMYSFEQGTGALAWSHSTGSAQYGIYSSPVAADTPKAPPTIYFGAFDAKLYALDARNGAERWAVGAGGAVSGAPSLVGEIVYVANISKQTTLGFNAATGKRKFRVKTGAYNPIISDGKRLYLTGYSTVTAYEVNAKKGRKLREKRGAGKKSGKRGT